MYSRRGSSDNFPLRARTSCPVKATVGGQATSNTNSHSMQQLQYATATVCNSHSMQQLQYATVTSLESRCGPEVGTKVVKLSIEI